MPGASLEAAKACQANAPPLRPLRKMMNRPAAKLIRLRWQKHSHQHIGLHLNADGARLLFQVFVDACERQSIVITTNLEFSRWGVGVRRRPDGHRRDRQNRPPREAHPVPWRVLPRAPRPHAGGVGAQRGCADPMISLLNFRCSLGPRTGSPSGRMAAPASARVWAELGADNPRRGARSGSECPSG